MFKSKMPYINGNKIFILFEIVIKYKPILMINLDNL